MEHRDFYTLEFGDRGTQVTLRGWSTEAERLIREGGFSWFSVDLRKWTDPSLTKLIPLHDQIKKLQFGRAALDVGAISELHNLEELSIVETRSLEAIDFLRLPRLRMLSCGGLRSLRGLEGARSVLKLSVGWPGKREDLSPIPSLVQLRELEVGDVKGNALDQLAPLKRLELIYTGDHSALRSLSGLEELPDLKTVSIGSPVLENVDALGPLTKLITLELAAKRLTSIEPALAHGLRTLKLYGCAKIREWHSVARLRDLEELHLEDCGEIPAISFLRHLRKLKKLAILGRTQVRDGDLECLLELPALEEVLLRPMRHYSRKAQEINDILSKRRAKRTD